MRSHSRRFFLAAATAAGAARVWGANDRLQLAIVGLGGRGSDHLKAYSKIPEVRVAGLCDVNQAAREKAQASLKSLSAEPAREFEDMRQAFADPHIDAVSTALPNHWHALAAIWAMQAGKDVYSEKPASHNIYETERMAQVASQTGRMLQIGSQHKSNPFKIRAIQALQGGLIGDLYLAKGLCYKRRKSIGHAADSPIPPGVNWDLFLGPAPVRPFNELRFKYNWHWFWDTGNGDIGNQGVHEMGICRWAFQNPSWPHTTSAQGGKFVVDDDAETPNTLSTSFDYGGRQIIFEVRGLLTDSEGVPAKVAPSGKGAEPIPVMIGNLFFGSNGWAVMNDTGFAAYRGESSEVVAEEHPEKGMDPTVLHMQNFVAACRSRRASDLNDPITIAGPSAALCHLANISYRTGTRLQLDSQGHFPNQAEAERLRTRLYRKPYVV